MNRAKMLKKLALAAALTAMTGAGAGAYAAGSTDAQPAKKCVPNPNAICPFIYAPVTCNNGQTYSNQCFADAACARGCKPANTL